MANPTHLVAHPNLSFATGKDGKSLERLPVGTPVTLNKKQAEKLGNRVTPINTEDAKDLSGSVDEEAKKLAAAATAAKK